MTDPYGDSAGQQFPGGDQHPTQQWQAPPSLQQPGYGQPYGQPYPQQPFAPPYGYVIKRQSTNGMAIASLVFGILWIYWLGSILALVFGYVARSQIRERGDTGDGMAIAGIVLGWIGVGILLLFILLVAAGAGSFYVHT